MKILNYGVSTLFLVCSFNFCFSQVTKFKTTSTAMSTYNDYSNKWREFESVSGGSDILISIDLTNERVKIFSKREQILDIIKYYDKKTDRDGDETIAFLCVDSDGLKCKVRYIILNSQEGRKQLYVGYSDVTYLYNIYRLE